MCRIPPSRWYMCEHLMSYCFSYCCPWPVGSCRVLAFIWRSVENRAVGTQVRGWQTRVESGEDAE